MIHRAPDSRKRGQTISFTEELFSVCVTEQREVCVKHRRRNREDKFIPPRPVA